MGYNIHSAVCYTKLNESMIYSGIIFNLIIHWKLVITDTPQDWYMEHTHLFEWVYDLGQTVFVNNH